MAGRIVSCPPGPIRPAMDRIRESMFAALGDLRSVSFLDLFAGSGIMSLEALSRGARKALLIEKDRKKKKTILENLKIAGGEESSLDETKLRIMPVERFLRGNIERYDVVHIDPPFSMSNKENLLILADRAGQPLPGGTLVFHYPFGDRLPDIACNLRLYDIRNYGQSRLAFYTRDN